MSEENRSLLERLKSNKTFVKLKGIKNIEIIIAIVVCVLAIGIYLVVDTSKKDTKSSINSTQSELEEVLGQIKGVGKINVLITYGTDGENLIGQDDSSMTLEPDTGSGSFWDTKGNSSSNKEKKIIGIIIVCEGAENPEVQAKLLSATQVATGVNIDRIRIYPMR